MASSLFYLISGIQPLSVAPTRVPELLWPLIALTTVHFTLNSGLVAIALAAERNESAFAIWRRIFPWLSLNYFGGASVAALLVSYTRTIDFMSLSIIVPLLLISYLTYKMATGRVEDAILHVDKVNGLYLSTIETLATAIDAKDQVTHGHIRRVQRFALGLAVKIGVKDSLQLQALEAAALLHDMGKIAVPEHILNKPSKLTSGEFEKMKVHASVGADILSSIKFPYPIVPIVRHHHENWDGTGYPDRLRGTEIPLGARILAVVDCFDALTSDRPYRPKLPDTEAIRILMERRGTMYDPLVVDTFVVAKDELAESLTAGAENPSNVEGLMRRPAIGPASSTSHGAARLERGLSVEFGHVVRDVLDSLASELSATLAVLSVKDASRDELVCIYAIGVDGDDVIGRTLSLGTRVSGWVAANGRPIVNTDAKLEFSDCMSFGAEMACTVLPIRSTADVIGTVTVVRPAQHPLDFDELKVLEQVCARFHDDPLRGVLSRRTEMGAMEQSDKRPLVH